MKTYKLNLLHPEMESDQIPMTIEIDTKRDWYGHSYGDLIGRIDSDGTIKSAFTVDTDHGNTDIFDGLIATRKLTKKRRYKRDDGYSDFYYLMYVPENHSSLKPTVTDQTLNLEVGNIRREFTFEIVLVQDEGSKRYVSCTERSEGYSGLSLLGQLSNIEETFENWCYEKSNGFLFCEEDNTIYVNFYDDLGEETSLWFNSMDELLNCIHSVRIVDMSVEIVK